MDTRERMARARSLLVLTGAGVSVASGLPTYRGAASSLYADPTALCAAFASTLRKDPAAVWRAWSAMRVTAARDARPNAAHEALAAFEAASPSRRFLLATQNVDGLHARAGSTRVVELHGSLRRARCLDDACPAASWELALDDASSEPPACPWCRGPGRPDVVLFGEGDDARWDPVRTFLAAGPVDVLLLVGTSGTVPVPAEVIRMARAAGPTWVVDVNPDPSIAEADEQIAARAEEVLPPLLGM